MRAANLLRLYRVRLRARLLQELFALTGIAAGVALLFAAQVSSASLQGSVSELSRGIVGDATLQLVARDQQGFPQPLLARVRQIPGVRVAAPLLEVGANATGPRGSASIELVGADESLSRLGGTLVRHTQQLAPFGGIGAVVLPSPLAHELGVEKFGQEVTLQLAGHTAQAPLYAQLSERQIGPLVSSPVAIAPLFFLQEMAGSPARVSRVLVHVAPGAQGSVRAALQRLAAGHLNVETTSYEEALFAQAATANDRSNQLFAAISALVGFLFAFNAMLLTVPQRRRLVVELRRDGYTPGAVIAVLALDALVLGLAGCALGLALGQELSLHVLHAKPAFFSLAFSVGSERVVGWQTVAIALCGGMLAALVAVLSPLRDILSRDPLAAARTPESRGRARAAGLPALAGLVCLVAASAILLLHPTASIPGMVLLVAALLLSLPLVLGATLALATRLARSVTSVVPHVAVMELNAAGARAVAIAATGALAVFGSVAIQGARGDLLKGLEGAAREANASSAVWVRPAGAYDTLTTAPFVPADRTRLARLAGVGAVSVYRGGLLDYGDRRVLVIAPPADAEPLLPAGQIVAGDVRQAGERLRAGGWVVLSRALASELHVHVGQTLTLPSPDPQSFRVAALSTNLGWAPGAIVMNAADYARAWGSTQASAYGISPAPGVTPELLAREVARALGPSSGFTVQTAAARVVQQRSLSHEALENLSQIATLIPIVAVLAMAAAMGAMIWQRRPRLAKLKLEGFPRMDLWRTILLESMLLLLVGCATGALFGLYGQQLADHALASAVSFPVIYSLSAFTALGSLALVIATALAILSLPGYMAASVPAALALQD